MKIVCDACEAKYSISDDKVRGKVFKIRCKKCSNVIVVRGVSGAEPEPPSQDTHVQHDGDEPAASDAIWHLVIQQEQIGPMTAGDVGHRFASGEINGETFAWREGQADWLPLAQLDAFASLVVATAPVESILPVATSQGGDELFASAPASEPSAAAQRLRGERNESSVLFSLGNLANIAGHKPGPAPSTIAAAMPQPAGGEGSGLIDIRSMASAYLGGGMQIAKPTAGIGSIDDLPVFGGGGFSEPAVLVPTPPRAGNSKVLYAMIGAIALLAVVAAVLIVMLLHRDPAPDQVASAPPAIAPTPPSPPAPVAVTVAEPSAPIAAPAPPPPPHALPPQHHDPKPPAVHAVTPVPKPEALAVKPAKPESAECDDISCVVNADSPCCMRLRGAHDPAKPAKPTIDPNLPEKLVASMITDAVANVKARVMACGDKSPVKGRVKVHVKVNPDGHVANVTVETSPDAKLGACVAAAVQRATFPKTQAGGSFGIPYLL